ncbi:MAG TPA: quinone-dependent dihydroorotate dehydrogenase [Burkholderiales bacterium]|nr:quinone-dependent dihydroorotate dehydrogenase [Burkholderiales bacterium]
MYSVLRPLLFRLDAETAHHVTLRGLAALTRVGRTTPVAQHPLRVMGVVFPNPVGLAAGLDKNGEYIDALAALGFGFIEIGTVTPRPQLGNPRPRLFRIPRAGAIVNRMGFNNDGVERLVASVARARYRGVLGINIGKNFDTPLERAADDYLLCLRRVYPYAGYITVNISSPNTRDLRQLQDATRLDGLLDVLKTAQHELAQRHGRYVPLAVKIAPDLDAAQIAAIARMLIQHKIDGVIATNTTVTRNGVAGLPHGNETGGLSGAPLRGAATAVVRQLGDALAGQIPIIGVGGIASGMDAVEKIAAGASLVQLYTGLIYRGPQLVRECIDAVTAVRPDSIAAN